MHSRKCECRLAIGMHTGFEWLLFLSFSRRKMGIEIERRFLVTSDEWKDGVQSCIPVAQGYFDTAPSIAVRVRICGGQCFLTVKKKTHHDYIRNEFEYQIPENDARQMLHEFCGDRIIEKERYSVLHDGFYWAVDVFLGRHKGLILAEIELESPDVGFNRPPWVGREVSDDDSYSNSALARRLPSDLASMKTLCRQH